MESKAEGQMVMVKLDDGEDLFASLKSVARMHGVTGGCILFGIGQIQDFELGYFDGKTYLRKVFEEPHELVGLHGTVTPDLDPPLHMHAAVSRDDFILHGGHLFKARVAVVGEICIQRFTTIEMRRELDRKTGLRKLAIR